MKKIITAIAILLSVNCLGQTAQKGNTCPVTGDNAGTTAAAIHHQKVDSYKNRSIVPKTFTQIQFDVMASLTVTNPMTWDTAVYLEGYVLEIQDGGSESCNCHSKNYKDTHIYIVKSKTETNKANALIVEATPRFRDALGSTSDLKKLVGQHVRVYGYLFRDDEHWPNSTIDKGTSLLWRHSVWEIHPIIKIQILN